MSPAPIHRTRPPANWTEQAVATARLAGPVIVARAGMLVLAMVDTVMTGRAGADQLAYLGAGLAVQIALLLFGIGSLMGTGILVAQAHGAGEHARCGGIWRVALGHAVLLGLLMGLLSLPGETFLRWLGLQPDLARGGGEVLVMFSWSMPAIFIYVASAAFLEAMGRPKPAMVVMLLANLVNIGFNWLLIYGHADLPALGANGAALATAIVRWLMAAALVVYCLRLLPTRAAAGVFAPLPDWRDVGVRLRRLGLPLGIAQSLESTAFMTVAIFAGRIGDQAMAGYQIAINLISMIFMCAIGVSAATAVQVGQAVGRADRRGVHLAGWTGVGLVLLVMAGLGLMVGLATGPLAAFYTPDREVQAIAAAALAVGVLFLVFDGAQAVLMGAARGTGDVLVPLLLQGFAFWGCAVPAAWLFGLAQGMGPSGLMLGLFVGVVVSSLTLAWRFRVVSRRALRRS